MDGVTRRETIAGLAAVAAATTTTASVRAVQPVLDDASRMDATPVARIRAIAGPDETRLAAVRAELKDALAAGRPLLAHGARHSMGGQALPRQGTAITFDTGAIEVDRAGGLYRARAGACWRGVIDALDPHGLSPKVTQSNHDFSLGGTFSVNAHGWAVPFGPMGGTVRAIRIVLADGTLVEASREHEPELFALAMGGYGLVGVILDLTLEAAPNLSLTPRYAVMSADRVGQAFADAAHGSASMAFGRLNVARHGFLSEASLVTFHGKSLAKPGHTGTGNTGALPWLARGFYRGQIGSESVKQARWTAETKLAPGLAPKAYARNALLDTPVRLLEERRAGHVDILHEYFVPPARLAAFLAACREIIQPPVRPGWPELLNVTLRWLDPDPISVLAYAPSQRVALVMSFTQGRTVEADQAMHALTERLIDAALAQGGGFYLPYRLHARRDQLRAAYPRWDAFAAAKRHWDPKGLFKNALWSRYEG
ncbi:FAD-binding oxidoreductase [Caulobacter segnis]